MIEPFVPSLILRRCLVALVCALIAASTVRIPEYWTLALRMWGEPMSRRGVIGADERHNPLGLSGHLNLRRELQRSAVDARPSQVAGAWRWGHELQGVLPADARVYVNVASPAVYFYASFFLYPVPVEVDSGGRPVTARNPRSEIRVVPDAQLGALFARGYTHVLASARNGKVGLLSAPARP